MRVNNDVEVWSFYVNCNAKCSSKTWSAQRPETLPVDSSELRDFTPKLFLIGEFADRQ